MNPGNFAKPYMDVYDRVLLELKREKLLYIVKPYQTVTFAYLSKRLSMKANEVAEVLFDLIVDKKVNGMIYLKEQYLEVLPEENYYFSTQLSNIQQLAQRL